MHRLEGCSTADALLKKQQILKLASELNMSIHNFTKTEIYDDNKTVLDMARSIGIRAFCSIELNKRLAA
jgi:hypothetical protein